MRNVQSVTTTPASTTKKEDAKKLFDLNPVGTERFALASRPPKPKKSRHSKPLSDKPSLCREDPNFITHKYHCVAYENDGPHMKNVVVHCEVCGQYGLKMAGDLGFMQIPVEMMEPSMNHEHCDVDWRYSPHIGYRKRYVLKDKIEYAIRLYEKKAIPQDKREK